MTNKIVLTIIAIILFVVALTWFAVPGVFFNMLGIESNTELDYMARRYAAYILGLGIVVWLTRDHADSPAGRGVMIGAFVGILLTSLASLYGALFMGLSWLAFPGEFAAALLLGWALFFKRARAS